MPTTDTIKRIIPPIVSLAIFMEAVDTTIINTAIPSMAHTLHVNAIDLKVALISYLISLAVFIPISGWLADRFGTKRIFMSAIAIFTLSSVWCGFASHLDELVIARLFQGLGGSLMIPVGRLIIIRLFHKAELIQTMNRIIVPALIGPALGPLLGGFITQQFSWRWIFWVNIPFGIINFILAYYWIQNFEVKKIPPFDTWGFILFGGGLASLAFGLSALSESDMSLFHTGLIILDGIILLTIYAVYSRFNKNPVLQTKLFQLRTFRLSIIGNITSRIGFAGVPFLLPLMLQIGMGFTPEQSGLMVALTAIGAMSVKLVSRDMIKRFGFKNLLLGNTVCVGLVLWLFTLVGHETSMIVIALFAFIFGTISSLQYSTMNPMAYADVPDEYASSATSLLSVTQQMAASFGVAACALILRGVGDKLTVPDFHHTFFIIGIITMLSSLTFLFLKKSDGDNLINGKNAKNAKESI